MQLEQQLMQQRPAIPATSPLQAHKLCVGLKMLKSLDRLCGQLPTASSERKGAEDRSYRPAAQPHTQEDRWMLLDIEGISRSDAMTLDGSLQDIQRNQFHEV